MLHGLGGSYREWYTDRLFDVADSLIASGEIPPLIIVLPQGEDAYWVDHANGGPRWGAYVARDLVGEIDANYRTQADRNHRAIGGMSMGGNGALQLAMNYPDVFSVVGAHSFALRRHDQAPDYFGDQTYFNAHDPVYLFGAHPDVARGLTLWLDVGNGDTWRPADEAFDRQLSDAGIAHSWHEFAGGHEDPYWSSHASDYLRFYGTALGK
jgi:enterochelin esterase-like enzyme